MIKIESQIWSVVDQNRTPLAYMTQVTTKKDGSPDAATSKKMETGRKWARNGAHQPTKYEDGKWVYDGPKIPANEGIETFYDNIPVKGFKVVGQAGRWTTEATYIEIEDPRGFKVQVEVGNLTTLMQYCTIINGVIQEECVWGTDNKHVLLPVHTEEYRKAVVKIEKVQEALKIKDLMPGDWVKLHTFGRESKEVQFLGMVKLEWTQHRQLYDTEYQRNQSRYYGGRYTQQVNIRDDGTETLKDSQWVGLFASDIVTTQIKVGEYPGGQPKYEYGPKEPGIVIENNSVKITERREGVVGPEYANLDVALSKHIYYNDGRGDCPERVKKLYEKQDCIRNSYEGPRKGLTQSTYSCKVYKKA